MDEQGAALLERLARPRRRQRRRVPRTCERCGTSFSGDRLAKYCGPACKSRAWEERHPEQAIAARREQQRRYVARKRRAERERSEGP